MQEPYRTCPFVTDSEHQSIIDSNEMLYGIFTTSLLPTFRPVVKILFKKSRAGESGPRELGEPGCRYPAKVMQFHLLGPFSSNGVK